MKTRHCPLSITINRHQRSFTTILCITVVCLTAHLSCGGETENVLLITLDGLRWQELFGGADQRLINKEDGGVSTPETVRQRYWRSDAKQRREVLMPFFWSVIAKDGQVLGDPAHNSTVKVTNGRFFSYPGYNELLCGFGDERIDSNDKMPNRNTTVLEWLHRMPEFQGRVAAFASWDVFPYIINVERSGIYVNAGWQPLEVFGDAVATGELNAVANELPKYWPGVRYDVFAFRGALDFLKSKHPRVLYVALGETDDWAHAGRYDLYLDAAYRSDQFIQRLWQVAQSIPQYKDKTTLIITTDHGRGDGRESWKSHSADIPGSDQTWIAVLGPDTPALGVRSAINATQSQTAATVASALGKDFTASDNRIAEPIPVFTAVD